MPKGDSKRTRSELTSSSSDSSFEIDKNRQLNKVKKLKKQKLLSVTSLRDRSLEVNMNMDPISEERLLEILNNFKQEIVSEIKHSMLSEIEENIKEKYCMPLEDKVCKLEKALAEVIAQNIELERKCQKALEVAHEAKAHAIDIEQNSRQSNIRVFGVPEEGQNENSRDVILDLFEKKLSVNLERKAIDAAHRVGRPRDGKVPGIIVKFMRRDDKYRVLKQRKKLKGSGITIVEDMCLDLQRMYNRMKSDARIEDAWTWNGKVYVKDKKNKIRRVRYGEVLDNLLE